MRCLPFWSVFLPFLHYQQNLARLLQGEEYEQRYQDPLPLFLIPSYHGVYSPLFLTCSDPPSPNCRRMALQIAAGTLNNP